MLMIDDLVKDTPTSLPTLYKPDRLSEPGIARLWP